jgi:transposase
MTIDRERYKDQIMDLWYDGVSCYRIAKLTGFGKRTIFRWLNDWHVDTSRGRKLDLNKPTLKSRAAEAVKLFESGLNCSQIAKKMGFCQPSVSEMLKEMGYDTWSSKVKYSVDETFFDVIDTEEKAWVLGLMYADGNVTKAGRVRIQLQEEDKETLEKVRKLLQYTGELIYIPPPKKYPHRKPQYLLNIDRKTLADALIDKGCVPAKSNILVFPTKEIIETRLLPHFIRGYFDGDGSVSFKNSKYLYVGIVGTFRFVCALQNVLAANGIESTAYPRYKKKGELSSYQLFVGKQDSVRKFRDLVYCSNNDCTYAMKRKLAKFFSV